MNTYHGSYEYAQRNGFTGSYAEHVELQYVAYAARCAMLGIQPLSRDQWT